MFSKACKIVTFAASFLGISRLGSTLLRFAMVQTIADICIQVTSLH